MPGEYKLSDSIRMILDLDADKRPTTATIHGIDGNHADISLAGSVAIVRHVEVVGNVNDVAVGDSVQIAWGNDNRPVVMLIGSGGTGGGIATVVADNQSIENSNSGLRVKAAGILRHHLGFTLPDESEFQDAFTAAGWTIDPDSGTIYHSGISISSGGMISLGSGEEVIKMSGFGVPDRPDSPEDDTDYRLWIGRIDPTFAPFAVDKYGHVVLRGGTVGGWSLTTDDIVSDAGNARIHSGARPYIGLGTDYYGGTGFWAGKDTDYIYKVSVGEAGGPQLTYDGTDLTLQDIDLKFYYGTNFTLWIQSDGDFAIGQDIDTVSSTSLRIFSNDQTYNGEAFTAGDIIIGDHSGAHMTWDQSAGQLQFRDGSETGTPVRAYVDTDGSIMFGDGQGRLDDQGIWIEAATSFGDEYPWNSVNWAWDLGGTGESLQGRISGAQGEIWIRTEAPGSRVSIGSDVDITGQTYVTWFQVMGSDGGEHLHWTYNDDLDGINTGGDLQHWVFTSPVTSAPSPGFGHRTGWYLQDGASSFAQAAFMDVVWIEGIGGGEQGSAFKFYVFPDASMTEMFRIGPLDADTATNEYPYAAVVNPQFHSEGNFLVGGTSNNVLIETDAGTNSIYLGASALYIEAGSWGNPDTGWGTLYHSSADNKLYWYDGTTAYDLTQAGAVLWQEVDTNTIYTSDSVTIGGNVNTFTNNQLLVVNSLPESGWTPNDNNASNIIIATNQPLAGMTVAVEDGAASMVEYGFEFANTGTNDYGGISFASPSHVTYPYGVLLYHSGYGFWLDASSGKWTKIGSTSQWSFNVAVTHNPDLADYDFIFYGDTKEVMRIDAGSDFVAINSYIRIAEGSSPGTPPGTTGYLYASSTTSDLHWVTDGGTDYNLTDPAGLWSSATGGLLYPATISDVVLIGTTTVENQALLTMEGAYTDVTGGANSWAEVVLKDDEDSVGEMHWHVGRYDTTQWIGGLSMNLELDPDTVTWSRINSSNGGALQQYWITNASTQLMWYLMNDLGTWWSPIQAMWPDGTGSVAEFYINPNADDADLIIRDDVGHKVRFDGSKGQLIVGTGAVNAAAPTGGSIDDSQERLWIHQEDDYAGLAISSIRDDTVSIPVASITGYASRGTTASPAATQSGDYLLVLGGRGYGTQWETTSAFMLFKAAENFTDTAHGADITFELKPTGTEARVETLYMSGTQVVINGDSGNIDFIVNGDSGEVFRVDAGLDVAQIATWLEMAEVTGPVTGEPGTGWGAVFAKSDGKIYYKNDGGTTYDLTATGGGGEWVESGGFLTQATSTDVIQAQNWIEVEDLSTANLPTTGEPGTGWGAIFAKASDGKLYYKNDAGTTYDLTQGGAGGYWTRNTGGYIYPSTTNDYLLINTNSTTGTNDTFNLFMQTVDYSGTGVLGVDMTGIAMGDINATGQPLATLQYLDYNTAGAWAADFLILGINLFYNEATDNWAQTDTSQEGVYFEMFTRMDNTVSNIEMGYVVENTPSNLIPWITMDSTEGVHFNKDAEALLDFFVYGDDGAHFTVDSGLNQTVIGGITPFGHESLTITNPDQYAGSGTYDTTWLNEYTGVAIGAGATDAGTMYLVSLRGSTTSVYNDIGSNVYWSPLVGDIDWHHRDSAIEILVYEQYVDSVNSAHRFYWSDTGTSVTLKGLLFMSATTTQFNGENMDIDFIVDSSVGEVFRVDGGLDVAQIATWLEFAELGTGATPTTGEPGTGFGAVYVKSDSKLYFKDDGGTEYDLTSGGGLWTEGINFITQETWTHDIYIGGDGTTGNNPGIIIYSSPYEGIDGNRNQTAYSQSNLRWSSQNQAGFFNLDVNNNSGDGDLQIGYPQSSTGILNVGTGYNDKAAYAINVIAYLSPGAYRPSVGGVYSYLRWSDTVYAVNKLHGVSSYVQLNSTTTQPAAELAAFIGGVLSSGTTGATLTNAYGLYITDPNILGSRTITNYYGIYSGETTSSLITNKYSIFTEGHTALFNYNYRSDADFLIRGDTVDIFFGDAGRQVIQIKNWLELVETTGPSTGEPATGWGAIYVKTDSKLYFKSDVGTEYDLTAGGATPEWSQGTGFLMYPSDNSGAVTVIVGNTTEANADFVISDTGQVEINKQRAASSGIFSVNGYTTGFGLTYNQSFLEVETSSTSIGIAARLSNYNDSATTNDGVELSFYMDDASTARAAYLMAGIQAVWTDHTDAAESSKLVFRLSADGNSYLYPFQFLADPMVFQIQDTTLSTGDGPGYGYGWIYVNTSDQKLYYRDYNDNDYNLTAGGIWADGGAYVYVASGDYISTSSGNLDLRGASGSVSIAGGQHFASNSFEYYQGNSQWIHTYYVDNLATSPAKTAFHQVVYGNTDRTDGGEDAYASYKLMVNGTSMPYFFVSGGNAVLEFNDDKLDFDFVWWGDTVEVMRLNAGLDNVQISTWLELKELAASPGTGEPGTGWGAIYTKTDNKLYFKNDGGTEYDLTSGGGSSILEVQVFS